MSQARPFIIMLLFDNKNNKIYRAHSLTAVVNSAGSAASLRCCPIGGNGVCNVGTVLVVNRLWSVARASVEAALCACISLPTPRRGEVIEGKDDSSRGD